MTIIEVNKVKSHSYMGQLMKKLVSNRCCLGLLRFFAAHPNGRFSKLAVIHALDEDDNRPSIENAIEQMIEEGIIKTIDWYLANRNWLANVVSGDYQKYYDSMYKNR